MIYYTNGQSVIEKDAAALKRAAAFGSAPSSASYDWYEAHATKGSDARRGAFIKRIKNN